MEHPITIGGRAVSLAWNQETAKRFQFRMGDIGGEPAARQLGNPRTVTTALFKLLWGMLPPAEVARYPDPESLFVAVDHEAESAAIFTAITAIYQDRLVSEEKKMSSQKSPSPESNSD